jgi:hypothetical protein
VHTAHPHDPPTVEARRRLGQTFGMLMGRDVAHVRVDYNDDRQYLKVVGTAVDLHGPHGVCTCCPRTARLTADGDVVGGAP